MIKLVVILILLLNLAAFSEDIVISVQPVSIGECLGNSVSLYVLANSLSDRQLKYQWYKDNKLINLATSPVLNILSLQHYQSGAYYCEISNTDGEIQKTNTASVYAIRGTSITKQPEDVYSNSINEQVNLSFDAHVNGFTINDAIQKGDFVKIQWFQVIENKNIILNNNDIYQGVNSDKLVINTISLADTTYYFAEIEGLCGKSKTNTVKVIKKLNLLEIKITGLETCEGNFEVIKANVNNPYNYKIEYQWFRNGMPLYFKENVGGIYTDNLDFKPIFINDSGKYKLKAKIKELNYSVYSNEVEVNICSKPEIIAIRIDSITTPNLFNMQSHIILFYKGECQAKAKVYQDSKLIHNIDLPNDYYPSHISMKPKYNYLDIIDFDKKNRIAKYSIELFNRCGSAFSDTISINDDLNDFTNKDPFRQFREFCEQDTTSLEYYYLFDTQKRIDYYWDTKPVHNLYDKQFYSGYQSNILKFKSLREIDNGVYWLHGTHKKKSDEEKDTIYMIGQGFYLNVKPIPNIKRQPINKTLQYGIKDTLIYIYYDNEKQEPVNVELYYLPTLKSKPVMIDKSEAEHGLWYRYIRNVSFAEQGYYYAVSKHYNDCKSVISDTAYIEVIPKGLTNINEYISHNSIISPNPATDFITINLQPSEGLKSDEGSEVEIYNSFGELVLKDVPHLQDVAHLRRIDVSHLPVGLYFVKIGNKVEKFVKM